LLSIGEYRTTHFPYTTLFRSVVDEIAHPLSRPRGLFKKRTGGRRSQGASQNWFFQRWACPSAQRIRKRALVSPHPSASARAAGRDRKSTRLTSTHVKTSYTVF